MEQAQLNSTRFRVVAMLLIVATIFLTFGGGIDAPFIYDDEFSVLDNMSIRHLWPVSEPLSPPAETPTSGRPLVNLSLALNYAIGGVSPIGYHVVNILLHAGAALLLFDVVRRTLQSETMRSFRGAATPLAAVVTLLWAVHPLNSEAVIYVTQRTELMMGLFYLATLWCAMRWWGMGDALAVERKGGRRGWLVAAGLCCAAGMACKEVMVTAPVVVLLYERVFVRSSWRDAAKSSWPLYVLLAAGWAVLAGLNLGAPRGESAGFGLGVSAMTWWMTQAKVFVMYLKLIVWPRPLLIHYGVPYEHALTDALPWVVPVVLLIGATLVGVWRRHPAGFVGAVVLLVLSPTMVVPILTEVAAERRMYLPLAAITALVVVGAHALVRRVQPVAGVGAAAAVVLAIACAVRVAEYRDPVMLWQQVIDQQHPDAIVMNNMGAVLADAGEHERAIPCFEQAIKLNPDSPLAYSNLGVSLAKLGRYDEAIEQYRLALRVDSDFADAHYNLGVRLLYNGQVDEAIEQFEAALRTRPDHVNALVNLGVAQLGQGRFADAVEHLSHALSVEPDHPEAHNNLGVALTKLDRWPEAVEQYQTAVAMDPQYLQAWVNLAAGQAQLGQMTEAVAAAKRAHELAVRAGDAALAQRLEQLIQSSP